MGSLFKKTEEYYCAKGLKELSQGRLKSAEVEFTRGLKSHPKSFSLFANRANVWLLANDFKRAADDYREALSYLPRDGQNRWAILLKRGSCLVRCERYQEALKDLDAGLESAPKDASPSILAEGYFYRALVRMDEQGPRAFADAKKAVDLAPTEGRFRKLYADLEISQTSPEARELGQRGVEYLQSGQFEKALGCFEEMLALEPEHAKAWQLKGATLHQLKRYQEELAALDKSYQINGNEVALFNRASCYIALGKVPEAKRDLQAFLEIGTHQMTILQAQSMLSGLD